MLEKSRRPLSEFHPQGPGAAAAKREKARVAAANREIAKARRELLKRYWLAAEQVERGDRSHVPPELALEIDRLKRLGPSARSFAALFTDPEGKPPTADQEHEITVATAAFLNKKLGGLNWIDAIAEAAGEYNHSEPTVRNWVEKHRHALRANAYLSLGYQEHLDRQRAKGLID